MGPGPDLELTLASSDEALEIRCEPATAAPTTVHVLLHQDGRLRGLIDLHLAPGVDSATIGLAPSQGASRSFELALVDTRPPEREPGMRLLGYDPALVPALPPPLGADGPL